MPSLKIDLSAGVLEAEGTEEFLRGLLAEFRSLGFSTRPTQNSPHGPRQEEATDTDEPEGGTRKPPRRQKRKPSIAADKGSGPPANYVPSIKKSLNLPGLKEFISPYELKTHPEKVLAFTMYLKEKMGMNKIEADDIFTAYRFAQIKPAGAFLQSIRDTSHKKTWVDYQSPTDIKVTPLGENHFLHDLPKNTKA